MCDFVVGDLLLCLHPQRSVLERAPRRSRLATSSSSSASSWQRLAAGDRFTLWVQPLQDDGDGNGSVKGDETPAPWRGYDLLTAATPTWQHWLLCDWVPRSVRLAYYHNEIATDAWPQPPDNGQFLLLAHHVPSGRFFAATDRFGTLHAYVTGTTSGTNGLALGTFSAAVAHHFNDSDTNATTLDPLGLASFACFGFYLGERTGYEHVHILRPGRLFALDHESRPHARELRRTAEWRYEPEWQRDFPDTVAAFDDVLRRTVEEHVADVPAGHIALPLSGGLDSRTLLAALTRGAHDPFAPDPAAPARRLWCYAYDYAGMRLETDIARRLATRCRGTAFDAFTVEPYLFALLPQLGPALEGAQDLTQCRQAAVLAALRERAEVVVAGHWGDVWLDGAWPANGNGVNGLDTVEASDDAALARILLNKALKPGHEWLLANFVTPLMRETFGGDVEPLRLLEEAMQEELARIPSLPNAQARLKAAKTETWSFRWTLASLRCYRMATRLRLPFYDSRLADFFATVPNEWMQGRALQIAYLKRTAPELAAVPWQAAGTSLFAHPQPRWQRLARGAARRAWRRLTNRSVIQRNWEVQLLPSLGRDRLRNTLLASPSPLHDLVPPARLRSLLDEFHDAPSRERAHAASVMLTLHDWLASV